jgi:hypothetical protein
MTASGIQSHFYLFIILYSWCGLAWCTAGLYKVVLAAQIVGAYQWFHRLIAQHWLLVAEIWCGKKSGKKFSVWVCLTTMFG